MSSWYIKGANGWHYCWNKNVTFQCPIGSADRLGDLLEAACEEANLDKAWLLRRLRHNTHRYRVNDRPTNVCDNCGHKLDRLGFRCWIERPYTEEEREDTSVRSTIDINVRLNGREPLKTIKSFYVDTKREAEQWAREEVALTKAIEEESANATPER